VDALKTVVIYESLFGNTHLVAEHVAEAAGLRTWFHGLGQVHGTPAAAFDTRFDGPAEFTGRASKGIGRRLRHHGFSEVAEPESFLVDKDNHLLAGESDRARRWADGLVSRLTAAG
jgi:hypothetical protein